MGHYCGMNAEFLEKMAEAKKLEKEALAMLLPEKVQGHLDVIEKEIKEMLRECLEKKIFGSMGSEKEKEESGKVKKVDIE